MVQAKAMKSHEVSGHEVHLKTHAIFEVMMCAVQKCIDGGRRGEDE